MWGRCAAGSRGMRMPSLLLCLLLAASSPAWCSVADPAGMTDAEILTELSEIYGRQQEKLASAETTLRSLRPVLEESQTTLRELQGKSTKLSADLRELGTTISASTTSLQSSLEGMETEIRSLKASNAWLKAGVWSAFLATLGISLLYMAR